MGECRLDHTQEELFVTVEAQDELTLSLKSRVYISSRMVAALNVNSSIQQYDVGPNSLLEDEFLL